jgi:hypothetical protein
MSSAQRSPSSISAPRLRRAVGLSRVTPSRGLLKVFAGMIQDSICQILQACRHRSICISTNHQYLKYSSSPLLHVRSMPSNLNGCETRRFRNCSIFASVMDGLDHDFDPDGNLVLLLRRTRISYTGSQGAQEGSSLSNESNGPEEPSTDEPDVAVTYAEAESDDHEVAYTLVEEIRPERMRDEELQDTTSEQTSDHMRVRVSSRHLVLASRTLKLLLPNSPEWPLLDDEPNAVLILLSVIHGRYWNVPCNVDLATLTEIAILVDKYDLHEAVSVMKDQWLHHLEIVYPDAFNEEILRWMCISWVFH